MPAFSHGGPSAHAHALASEEAVAEGGLSFDIIKPCFVKSCFDDSRLH
jgi:hypothetical protein